MEGMVSETMEKGIPAVDNTPAERWNGRDNIAFSIDQLKLISKISYKQLGVLSTFTQKQLDALKWAYSNAEHNT